jgi:hypothetical protein
MAMSRSLSWANLSACFPQVAEQKEPHINNGLEAAVVNFSLIGLRAPSG